jgi:hypothetical protein
MRTHLKRKEVDDVLGGKDSWANVDVVDGESMSMSMSSASRACPFHLISKIGGGKESEGRMKEMGKKRRRDGRKEEDGKANPSYLPGMR